MTIHTPMVLTLRVDANLRDAAMLMRDEKVGSLVVVDEEGNAVGMLTDRDLALRAVAFCKDPDKTLLKEVMTTPLTSVDVDAGLDEVASMMRSTGIRRVPVLRDQKPLGLYSLDDILSDVAGALHDVSDVQAVNLRGPEAAEVDDLASEISSVLEHAKVKLRETSWRAQSAFLADLDDIRDRMRHALDILRPKI